MTSLLLGLALTLPLQTVDPQPAAAHPEHGAEASGGIPLYGNLGEHHYPITTSSSEAQAYFDQGLRLYYAFNHAEAVRSFGEAQRLDPSCAMCWWGEALAYGPNINMPMDSASAVAAWTALERARSALDDETARERALISALGVRYAPVPSGERAALDSAYARAMAEVAGEFPDDPEVAVLHGESLLDLRPWDYWTRSGEPQPGTLEALGRFERVMARNPDHPGACHFFIHAVEAVDPDRAVPCAERLATLMPGAGHLVHMPGHIYIRVGRYADAIAANEHAVHADESWIQDQRPGMSVYTAGYYPHNYDFLAFAAAMAGRRAQSLEAARKVQALVPVEMMGDEGMSFLQHWWARPLQIQVRFGLWSEILASEAPPAGHAHTRALWHYARGRALAATGRADEARAELVALREAASDPALVDVGMEFNLSTDLLAVAEHVLAGVVAEAEGDTARAVTLLHRAAELEDALTYGEPPEWTVPVRHDLGAVLLRAGRAAEAEEAYRQDLARFRESGWSLDGLARALRAQGRDAEAAEVEARFRRAWEAADGEIPHAGH